MNHLSGPRVEEGKWDSRVVRRVRVSDFEGVVRDIVFEVMRRDWEMGGDVGIAVLSGGLCCVDVLCRCGVYTYLRSGVMDPQFAYILYVSGCIETNASCIHDADDW